MTAPVSTLISVDLPAPLSPMTPRISFGLKVEIGMVQRHHATIALDEAARLQDRLVVHPAHADTFLIH